MDPSALATALAAHPSIRSKLDIAGTTRALSISAGTAGMPGDDAAAIPAPDGTWELLAGKVSCRNSCGTIRGSPGGAA